MPSKKSRKRAEKAQKAARKAAEAQPPTASKSTSSATPASAQVALFTALHAPASPVPGDVPKCLDMVPEELDKVISWQQRYQEHCQQAGGVLVEGYIDEGVCDVPLILPFRLPVPENICNFPSDPKTFEEDIIKYRRTVETLRRLYAEADQRMMDNVVANFVSDFRKPEDGRMLERERRAELFFQVEHEGMAEGIKDEVELQAARRLALKSHPRNPSRLSRKWQIRPPEFTQFKTDPKDEPDTHLLGIHRL